MPKGKKRTRIPEGRQRQIEAMRKYWADKKSVGKKDVEKTWTDRRWSEEVVGEYEADVGGKEAWELTGRKKNRITGELV